MATIPTTTRKKRAMLRLPYGLLCGLMLINPSVQDASIPTTKHLSGGVAIMEGLTQSKARIETRKSQRPQGQVTSID